jgi:hypothetical protein
MTDAILTPLILAGTNTLTGVGTWYATRVSLAKVRSDEAQKLVEMLMAERREREEEIRKLRADIKALQVEREIDRDHVNELFELDRRIRHDGATLIRNLLTRALEHGLEWPDLLDRNRELERLREARRIQVAFPGGESGGVR